jgi:hypothetical protein
MTDLTKQAVNHTLHCLLGCSIGEILGMVLAAAWGWSNGASVIISIALAFFFGYLLTFQSIYRKSGDAKSAARNTVATDTTSIISMEAVDNAFILTVPGAISAQLIDGLFWWSLLASLLVAFVITVPVNRFFIAHNGNVHHH